MDRLSFSALAHLLAGVGSRGNAPPTPSVTVRAMPPAMGPAYMQPFQGLHNDPYPTAPLPSFQPPGGTADRYMPMSGYMQPKPQPPANPAIVPPMPPSIPIGMPTAAPISTEMQGMPAPSPMGRNALERDYLQQLAQNPNGFDKGWLGRLFG